MGRAPARPGQTLNVLLGPPLMAAPGDDPYYSGTEHSHLRTGVAARLILLGRQFLMPEPAAPSIVRDPGQFSAEQPKRLRFNRGSASVGDRTSGGIQPPTFAPINRGVAAAGTGPPHRCIDGPRQLLG